MPLQRATDGKTTMTQFEMHACEALGLLKFDFLGLINLTILADAVELVKKHRGIDIDVDKLPLDDARTYDLLGTGETTGIFQLESSGMRRYVKELKPTEVRDLAAMVALFRPGPMANIPSYIRRKHGEEPVTYLHPALEPALRDTYGIFVYQEDIMTAAIAMAEYTGPEADNLCYAIRKKKEKVLREHESKFKAGAKKKGIPPQIVDQVFAAFEPFARYGFNKAHATCYGLIAYQTAYLKANYPIEFMTAVLNGFRERAEKVAAVIAECRRLGIEVRPPDVQKSSALFTVETDANGAPEAIRFGLAAIKNVGEHAVEAIAAVRDGGEEPGPFRSLDDFCRRVDLHTINRRVIESLVKANALASLGTAGALLEALDAALENGQRHQRDVAAGQGTLFDLFAPAEDASVSFLDSGEEIPRRERLRWEKELIGLYLSEHPLGDIADVLPEYVTAYTGDLAEEEDQSKVTLGGIVLSSRRVVTRAGSTMLVATLEDLQGSVEVVVFPKVFEQTAPSWTDDSVVLVTGRIDRRDESPQILCEAVTAWDDAVRMGPAAFGAERDRLLSARGGRRWSQNGNGDGNGGAGSAQRVQGVWAGGGGPSATSQRRPVSVSGPPPTPVPVGVAEPPTAGEDLSFAVGAPAPGEDPPAPRDAVPLQSTPVAAAAMVAVSIGQDVPVERLLAAIESVKGTLAGRPGPLPVVLNLSVAGATRQVRLPDRVAWDERLGEIVRREAGVPVNVELRTPAEERPA
jgi:DNA polymerase-3 subunit alpha